METMPMKSPFDDTTLTVSEFLDVLNIILKPCVCSIQGEIGEDLKRYPNYSFFKLLDKQGSVLSCFAWKASLDQLGVPLQPGVEVRVKGYPSVYKKNGSLSFQVERVELVGAGDLKKQFQELFKELEKAGYFLKERKRPIPRFCQSIGLITSKQASGALNDFLKHLAPFGFRVALYDTRVEGAFATEGISRAIQRMNTLMPPLDVLVITRGGGAWETFQPFNTKEIVQAIAASAIPIITAIGHEKDETLSDFVADLRASTPTDAAKLVSAPWEHAARALPELKSGIGALTNRMFLQADARLAFTRNTLANALKHTAEKERQELRSRGALFARGIFAWRERVAYMLKSQQEKLSLGSPELKLKQGYSMTLDEHGRVLKDARGLAVDQIIQTRFYKSRAVSQIQTIHTEL